MANFFYFDQNNQKLGPVTEEQLKELAAQGAITLHTPMETDTGHQGVAGQIPGLFATAQSPSNKKAIVSPSATKPCTNCGNPVPEKAAVCMSCGCKPTGHKKFCRGCGTAINPGQIVCLRCGASLGASGTSGAPKNKATAGGLAILLGWLGVHKFYMGSWGWGIVFCVVCMVCLMEPVCIVLVAIVGIVEGIIYLRMTDEAFAEKYPAETEAPFRW